MKIHVGYVRALVCLALVTSGFALVVARPTPAAASADEDYGALMTGMHDLRHYWRLNSTTPGGEPGEVFLPDTIGSGQGGTPMRYMSGVTSVAGAWGTGDNAVALSESSGVGTSRRASTRIGSSASLDLWVKPASLPAPAAGPPQTLKHAVIFDTAERDQGGVYPGKGFLLDVDSNGRLWGSAGFESQPTASVSAFSSTLLVPDRWYHVNLTWLQTGELNLSVDGTEEASVAGPPQSMRWDYGGGTGNGVEMYSRVAVGTGANTITGGEHTTYVGAVDEVALVGGDTAADAMSRSDVSASQAASGKPVGGIPIGDPRSLFGANGALKNGAICQVCVLDPINAGTGNLVESLPGISVAARGPGLSVGATYNSLGSVTDSGMGYGWSNSVRMHLERDLDNRIVVIQEDGSAVPFDPQFGGVWRAGPSFAATLTLSGSGSGSGSTYTYTRQKSERFTFDAPPAPSSATPLTEGRLTAMSDLAGNTTSVHYPSSSSKEADWLEAAGNRRLNITWTGGRITRVQESLPANADTPRWIGFGYTNGDLTRFTDVSGGQWAFDYSDHHMTGIQKPRHAGTTTKVVNEYDLQGRVTAQTDELNRQSTLSYDYLGKKGWTLLTRPGSTGNRLDKFVDGRRVETIEGYGSGDAVTTAVDYEADGTNGVKSISVGGHVTHYHNNPDGYPLSSEDPSGRITRWTYDEFDEIETETVGVIRTSVTGTSAAAAVTNVINRDDNTGLVTSTVLASGSGEQATTVYHRDSAHPDDVTTITDAEDHVWSSTYDPNTGQVLTTTTPATIVLPNGATTTYVYDKVGRVLTITDPIGSASAPPHDHETKYTYDVPGRKTTVVGPTGDRSESVLDADGHLWKQTERIAGSQALTTTSTYDDAGQLWKVSHPAVGGVVTEKEYSYSARGQLKTVENEADQRWTYGYDAAGNLTSEKSPPTKDAASGVTTTHGYDSAGRLESTTQPGGGTIGYTYDGAGRLTETSYSDPSTADIVGNGVPGDTFEHGLNYDALGRRVAARTSGPEGVATETWGWNPRSELTSHRDVNNDTTAYHWTKVGGVDRITYPGQATPVERGFDAAGQLTSVKDFAGRTTEFAYDANGNWITTKFGSTTAPVNTDTMAYDAANRLQSVIWAKAGTSTPLGSETYTRPTTTAGMVTATDAEGAAGPDKAYGYDERNRLATDTGIQLGLDRVSNTIKTADGRVQAFDPSQRLCWTAAAPASGSCATPPLDAVTYGYDARGNRTTATTADNAQRVHTYDQENRLTAVSDGSGLSPAPIADMNGVPVSGDYDQDGQDDVFFYRSTNTANDDWVWWGTERPQFGAAATNYSVGSGYTPMSGDFNCDGNDDIFWYKPGTATNNDYVWFWFGRDTAPDAGYTSKQFNAIGTYTPVAGDFDADGCSDVFWYAPGTTADVLWWGDEDVAQASTTFDVGFDTVSGTDYKPVAGDFDGNGTDDIFWYGPGAAADSLWLWSTNRTHAAYARSISTSTYDLAAGDVNGDGDDDLLFSNPSGSDVIWWGGSEATFGSSNQNAVTLGSGVMPVFGDYDGDGKDDLFVYLPGGPGDTVWWGTAQAAFGTTPVGLQAGATGSSTYRYDSAGLRSGKSVKTYAAGVPSTAVTTETWDTSGGLPLLLREQRGGESTFLFYGPGGQPFEQVDVEGNVSWLHRDQLGSVRLATDGSGATVSTRSWDAYGNPVVSTGSAKPLLGYAGQYTDAETGYQYLRARYYDPKTTQFLTLDPLVAQTGEPYGYATANPVNASDPAGLCSEHEGALGWVRDTGCAVGDDIAEAGRDGREWIYRNRDAIQTGFAVVGGVACTVGTGFTATAVCVTATAAALSASYYDAKEDGDMSGFYLDAGLTAASFGAGSCFPGPSDEVGRLVLNSGLLSLGTVLGVDETMNSPSQAPVPSGGQGSW